ncbi:hypothetical protein Pmani_035320 [Petrolisthes manimaculis]|uniref:Mpv17-like protein 2 n=1 Tax=Petrolisthes manimaculis TaxID=1843537 RepID=A0AAE1NKT3_9EUCA|nr:hypothetical protein Pmani_035320 [Petrolisthes manimaculis]
MTTRWWQGSWLEWRQLFKTVAVAPASSCGHHTPASDGGCCTQGDCGKAAFELSHTPAPSPLPATLSPTSPAGTLAVAAIKGHPHLAVCGVEFCVTLVHHVSQAGGPGQMKPVLAAMIRGVDLVRKVLNSSIIVSSRRLIHTAFSKHLFITNVTISFSLSGFGDLLQQRHNLVYRQQEAWDAARTRHMTCSGITVGALCHHWYNLLDRRLPGHTIQVALKKLLVDQLLFSPVCLTVFFLSLGLFKGGDWQEFLTDLQHKGWRLYAAEWLVWPPVQLFNFYFLPTKFRVLFDNAISLLFDVYTSHVCYDAKFAEEDDQGKITGLHKKGKEMSVLDLQEKNCGDGRPTLTKLII